MTVRGMRCNAGQDWLPGHRGDDRYLTEGCGDPAVVLLFNAFEEQDPYCAQHLAEYLGDAAVLALVRVVAGCYVKETPHG